MRHTARQADGDFESYREEAVHEGKKEEMLNFVFGRPDGSVTDKQTEKNM